MLEAFAPVFLVHEIRHIEKAVSLQSDAAPLMTRAGLATAELAREMLGERGKRVLVLAGPGNNGGDAFVAAHQLKAWWYDVTVVFTGLESKLPPDAKTAHARWLSAGGVVLESLPSGGRWHLIVDGLFGVGLQRPLDEKHAELVHWSNGSGIPVLAVDIPSGLHADSGRVLGCAIRACRTLTFIGSKAGLLTLDGPDHAGDVSVDALGVLFPERPSRGRHIESSLIRTVLPPRPRNSHKGSFGNVGVVGGASGMVGAALLAGRAALKLGAGRVFVGLLADAPEVDLVQPELMLRSAQDVLKSQLLDCLVVGPGLGASEAAQHALAAALAQEIPVVLDADALNLLAIHASLEKALQSRTAACVLTPHPAEAARLLGTSTPDIQQDRVASACRVAERFNASVVLKGNGSICAFTNGDWFVNTSGNPGMASAGMGDVLAGMIASFIAQGAAADLALLAGVHLHGLAADELVVNAIGPAGLTASEVIDAARQLFNRMRMNKSSSDCAHGKNAKDGHDD